MPLFFIDKSYNKNKAQKEKGKKKDSPNVLLLLLQQLSQISRLCLEFTTLVLVSLFSTFLTHPVFVTQMFNVVKFRKNPFKIDEILQNSTSPFEN